VAEFEGLTLRNGALTFSAVARGSGPLVLCLHGFPDNLQSYRHQLPALADAGYRAVSVSLRGYEPTSQPADNAYALEAIAEDVVAFVDELGAEKAHLIGHDWGAAIAYMAGALAPHRFRSLTTMAVPHSGRFLTDGLRHLKQLRLSWYMVFFQLRGIADYHLQRKDFEFVRMLWRHWSPGWELPEDAMRDVIDTLRQPGVAKAALAYYRTALSPSALPISAEARNKAWFPVPVPTLALTGQNDGCIDSGIFQSLMRQEDFPNGLKVRQIDGAGHFLHQEQPQLVNALLIDWLREHDEA
jgi:pimeloyl-ACP methyl ester carboxylesterase